MKKAIIDLGTNTFHILIAENGQRVLKHSIAVKLGAGGIENGIIKQDAFERAYQAFQKFEDLLVEHQVKTEDVFAFGTSAMRNASNADQLVQYVYEKHQIKIEIIDGLREAELIYKGVSQAVHIEQTSLIVDIGGGSVEFIICDKKRVLWKNSFEIGGQRLMERFMKQDPISPKAIDKMNDYFREALLPLANACHQYHPKVLIGSSGSFDTLIDMEHAKLNIVSNEQVGFELPLQSFQYWYETLVTKNRAERSKIPGMIDLRVEMIVVAVCLIKYLIQTFDILQIKVSNYALKEGVVYETYHA